MTDDFIQVANPHAQYLAYAAEIRDAIQRVLDGGHYVLGEEVAAFEAEFAAYVGVSAAVGVGSGTDALALALRAVGVRAGDEVVTVSHSAVATAAAIRQIGAEPVFADIDAERRCLDPEAIAAICTERTRAIVPVHIYGQPADMAAILALAKQRSLPVVEDCAQAHGAAIGETRVGGFGAVAAFSFYPTKNLGAIGDGGAVVTSDPTIAERLRLLRQYGWRERYISESDGFNSRLDELQAAILRVKLRHLDADNGRRRQIAAAYGQALTDSPLRGPRAVPGTLHAMHLYVLECEERDRFEHYMQAKGIGTGRHYPLAIHQQPAYAGCRKGSLARTEQLYRELVTLPLYPQLSEEEVRRICAALREWKQ
jgi:dTDP-4-amino-4,6-dideoxygalactose transaminase